jgi:hypothetical protein
VIRDSSVYTNDYLVSLPGFRSEIRLNNGMQLQLWGDLPDPASPFLMLESAAVLHDNPEFDIDLTLKRGRVIIENQKPTGPGRARIRFYDVVWDLTLLDNGTEVGIEMNGVPNIGFSKNPPKKGEGPIVAVYLFVLRGQANLKVRYVTHLLREPRGPAFFSWNNRGGDSPVPLMVEKDQLPPWAKKPALSGKEGQARRQALEKLANRLTGRTPVELVLQESLKDSDMQSRILTVFCYAATDDLADLLEALADEQYPDIRATAIFALTHWLGLSAENDLQLCHALEAKYNSGPAEIIMELMHPYSAKQMQEPETYETLIAYLQHPKLPIRQLAHARLLSMVPQGKKIPYDPAGGTDQRDNAYEEWKKLIPTGKLPPKDGAPPSGGRKPNR